MHEVNKYKWGFSIFTETTCASGQNNAQLLQLKQLQPLWYDYLLLKAQFPQRSLHITVRTGCELESSMQVPEYKKINTDTQSKESNHSKPRLTVSTIDTTGIQTLITHSDMSTFADSDILLHKRLHQSTLHTCTCGGWSLSLQFQASPWCVLNSTSLKGLWISKEA